MEDSYLWAKIQDYYGETKYNGTPQSIQNDRTIMGKPFKRWYIAPAAMVFQAICGSVYAWSVFNLPIDFAIYGSDQKVAPITFYINIGCLGLAASLLGPWLERHGPKKAAIIGGSLFCIGHWVAALGIHFKSMALVFFGYGVVSGLGLGLCYISPISALQKWFPERKGFGAGLSVCGFGIGGLICAKIPLPLISAIGLTMTFVVIGAVYWVILMFCAVVFRFPPPERNRIRGPIYRNGTLFITRKQLKYSSGHEAEKSIPPLGGTVGDGKIPGLGGGGSIGGNAYGGPGHGVAQNRIVFEPAIDLTLKEALTTYEYLGMYLMFLANLVSGLVILSRLADMCINVFDKSADTAATVVAINGGFNFVGRLMFSSLSDVIGRKPSYLVMLGTQVVILAVLPLIFLTRNYWAFLLAIWTLTCAYGGGFGTIPAFIHDLFGVNNISGLHGILLTAWSIAGVGGGILFTLIYNHLIRVRGYTAASPEVYNANFYWLSACAASGFLVLLFVRSTVKDRLLPKVGGEVTRMRIFGRILRFEKTGTFKFKLKYLKPEEEEKEWTSFWKNIKYHEETTVVTTTGSMGDVMGGTERDRGMINNNNNTGAGIGNMNIDTSSRGGFLGGGGGGGIGIGGNGGGGSPGSANNGSPGPSGTSEISLLRGDASMPPRIETPVPAATISGTSILRNDFGGGVPRNDVRLDMP
ncbi:hypothetical protein EC957_002451 [Mortierella hygrophila]|uniref:Major facilitator superfamily (MFS) profile domain-containing protein n=1 Tax=Mortierella hygrophila TaxID=979708 RepID=A0A9P6K7E5_9FUNG|nr:hypothetical protein EC957_002451 [Mortierella hygrophila]